jgi:spore germination protein PE
MIKRVSKVDYLKVNSVGSASFLQIGDSNLIHSVTRALAVQRQKELFFGNEGDFRLFPIFNRLIPLTPILAPITMHPTPFSPPIKVGRIDIIAVASASIVHIGSSEHIQIETRIKHIRQFDTTADSSIIGPFVPLAPQA